MDRRLLLNLLAFSTTVAEGKPSKYRNRNLGFIHHILPQSMYPQVYKIVSILKSSLNVCCLPLTPRCPRPAPPSCPAEAGRCRCGGRRGPETCHGGGK